MPVSALSTILISDPAWVNARTIPASGVVATDAVNQPGSLSCVLTLDDVARLGRVDLVGAWLFYEHPTQGPFAMIVDDDPSDLDAGTVSLSCTSLGHALLMDRSSPVFLQPDTGHAGALARRALTTAQTANPLPFQSILCDESGPQVDVEWRGEPIYDVIADLVNQTGQEFDCPVDSEKNLSFVLREMIGEDKSDRVLICEGYHVAGGHVDHSRLSVTNDITGIASDEDYARSATARIENETSIARYGHRQSIRRYDNAVSPLTVKAKVRSDIRAEGTAPHLPTITLPAMHPVCNEIRHGDTIRYWSRSRNRELLFRVLSRTVRDGAVLELAGIAEEVAVPPVVRPFTPDLLSGLMAWYDAADATTLTLAGNQVTEWRDKTGHGLHLYNPTSGDATYTATSTGIPVVSTDGTGYLSTVGSTLDLSSVNSATIFLVARLWSAPAPTAMRFPYNVVGIAVDPDFSIDRDATDHLFLNVRGNGATVASFQHTDTWGTSDYHLVTATVDLSLSSNEATMWSDGVSAGTRPSNGNNSGPLSSGALSLFPHYNFGELLVYKGSLTTAQRTTVENYLSRKWSIS